MVPIPYLEPTLRRGWEGGPKDSLVVEIRESFPLSDPLDEELTILADFCGGIHKGSYLFSEHLVGIRISLSAKVGTSHSEEGMCPLLSLLLRF